MRGTLGAARGGALGWALGAGRPAGVWTPVPKLVFRGGGVRGGGGCICAWLGAYISSCRAAPTVNKGLATLTPSGVKMFGSISKP